MGSGKAILPSKWAPEYVSNTKSSNNPSESTAPLNCRASVNDSYTALVTEAPSIPGDDGSDLLLADVDWLDKSLIQEGYQFHVKYYSGVILSTVAALVFGFAVKPMTSVLLRTGKLYDPELSFQRYLSTLQRVTQFFMLPFNPTEADKAFRTVRKMHKSVSKTKTTQHADLTHVGESLSKQYKEEMADAMRKDLEFIDTSSAPHHLLTWDPPLALSQFDMVITQLGFVGSMWLFPRIFRIKNRDEMKGMFHLWAIFGRLLGIQDRYNLCINPNPEVIDKVFQNVLLASLKSMDDTVVTIQYTFMKALNRRFPFVTYKAAFYYGLSEIDGYKGVHLWKAMSWKDKISFKFLQLLMWFIRCSKVTRFASHVFLAIFLQFQCWLYLPNGSFPGIGILLRIAMYSVY